MQVSRFFSLSETQCLGIENQYQRFQATAHPVAIKNLITFASHPIKDRLINGNTLNGSGNFFNGKLHLLMWDTEVLGNLCWSPCSAQTSCKTEQITLNFSCLSAKWGHRRLVRNEKSQYSSCGHVSKTLLWSSRISFRIISWSYFSQICLIHHNFLIGTNIKFTFEVNLPINRSVVLTDRLIIHLPCQLWLTVSVKSLINSWHLPSYLPLKQQCSKY